MNPIHPRDLIRKKRDGEELEPEEIAHIASGAALQTIPGEQLAAWLMAVYLRGLTPGELAALTLAMRDSGEKLTGLPGIAVDKHSTGGVGDKTSFLVAPIAAAAGLLDPMISGRALGHTGGTLDKLESIPGYRTGLSLAEMRAVLLKCGASINGQTAELVPADRVLYSLRDRTATVENPYLICASIMSKKLAVGLDALVLDVKTGSGAFLRRDEDARLLAALMVDTGERAGVRTAALLTNMDQPLGRFSGNAVEIAEALALLRNERHPLSEDLRELSLVLAGWMLHLGGRSSTPEQGRAEAERLLTGGRPLEIFLAMVEAHGGDLKALTHPAFHSPSAKQVVRAERSGHLAAIDCTAVGWAVQRLGAGRERAGDLIDPHAGLEMHTKLGCPVEAGEPLCTVFSSGEELFAEPLRLLEKALVIEDEKPTPRKLVGETITAQNRFQFLESPPALRMVL